MDSLKTSPLFRSCVVCVCCALLGLFVLAASDEEEEKQRRDAIAANLNPFGNLCLVGEDCGAVGPSFDWESARRGTGLSGKGVYDRYCSECHAEGLLDAPLVGSEAWEPRVDQGYDVLLQHTKEGFNQLPAMGNCNDCTDEELEAAILYLITGEEEAETEDSEESVESEGE